MLESLPDRIVTTTQELRSRTIGLIVLSFVIVIAAFWSTFSAMADIWGRSDTFAHGMIVGPIALYLIIRERHVLSALAPRPYWPGLGLLLTLSLFWMVGRFLGVNAVEQFAAVGLIPATVLTLVGPVVVRAIAFPLGFLLFAVPFGEFLIPQLMEITADLTTWMLQITGFAVYREGFFIAVPGGDFEIAKACSGIRYLIASIVLGTIFAYLTFNSGRKRLIFIGLSVLIPIIANGIRAYMIVVLASLSGMRLAVGIDHFIYGWVFFGIVMFVLFGIGVRFRDDHTDNQPVAAAAAPGAPGSSTAVVVAALAVMLAGPAVLYMVKARAANGPEARLARLPQGWQSAEFDSRWQPSFQPSDKSLRRAITNESATIYEFVDVYDTANGGVDAASSTNLLVDKKIWRIQKTLPTPDASMQLVAVKSGASEMYVATWYQIGARRTTSAIHAKLSEAWDTFAHGGSTSAIVAFAIDGEEDNLEVLMRYVAEYHPALSNCLANTAHSADCAG